MTGATGFVGRTLVHHLSERGAQIKILAREGSEARTLAANYAAELVVGDILSTTAVSSACANTTHIFHLAGRGQSDTTTRNGSRSATDTQRVNVSGTKILARCAAGQPAPPKFIHFSTVAVHGDVGASPGDERSPFNASTTYELTKLEAELWLKNYAQTNELPLTVLRPCAIIGPGDERLLKLFRLAKRKWLPIPGAGSHRYQLIQVDDCARVMLAAAESATQGETYVCGNEQTMTLREILEVLGPDGQRIISLPIGPLVAVLGLFEKLCRLVSVESPLALSRLAFFTHNRWFDTTKLRTELAPKFEHTNRSALTDTRSWYQEQGLL